LNELVRLNPLLTKTPSADFHGHGWVFRAVFKHDRQGRLLDHDNHVLADVPAAALQAAVAYPQRAKDVYRKRYDDVKDLLAAEAKLKEECKHLPVHLMDIHIEKGMHCVDCHFAQDNHGNGRLHMEVRAACEIQCVDCHGSATDRATLRTSGPAHYTGPEGEKGRDLTAMKTPFNKRRFEK